MKILAFAASNSSKSINKALIAYSASQLDKHDVEVLDINDFEMPMYNADLEEAHGIPRAASAFFSKIGEADALVISFAEHNGNYTVAYKNLFDWSTRINKEVYQGKKIVMLSTSPGPGGAKSVLALAQNSAHFFNGNVVSSLSIPSFYDNFDMQTTQLTNAELVEDLATALSAIEND